MTDLADTPAPNAERGEAALKIGSVDLLIAVTFDGLARLSRAARAESLDQLYRQLLGFEPFTAACAIRELSVHPAGHETAAALADRALGERSAADEDAFRAAIGEALTAHFETGKARRAAPPDLAEAVDTALSEVAQEPGKPGAAPA